MHWVTCKKTFHLKSCRYSWCLWWKHKADLRFGYLPIYYTKGTILKCLVEMRLKATHWKNPAPPFIWMGPVHHSLQTHGCVTQTGLPGSCFISHAPTSTALCFVSIQGCFPINSQESKTLSLLFSSSLALLLCFFSCQSHPGLLFVFQYLSLFPLCCPTQSQLRTPLSPQILPGQYQMYQDPGDVCLPHCSCFFKMTFTFYTLICFSAKAYVM